MQPVRVRKNYLLSSFGRLNYDFGKKYFISAISVRMNIQHWELKEVFLGASAGWEITKENFWADAGLDGYSAVLNQG